MMWRVPGELPITQTWKTYVFQMFFYVSEEGPGRGDCEKPVNYRPGRGQGDTRIFDIITNIGVSFLVSKKSSEMLGAKYRKRREQRETIS